MSFVFYDTTSLVTQQEIVLPIAAFIKNNCSKAGSKHSSVFVTAAVRIMKVLLSKLNPQLKRPDMYDCHPDHYPLS